MDFFNIFSKGRIGKYETMNRVKWAACCVSNFNNRDGSYSEREYARDRVIADMGCGIITNQGAYPDKIGLGKAYSSQISINDDKYIPGLKKVADIFHKNGAIAIQQILHGGRYGGIDLNYCIQPSAVEQTLKHFRTPHEMTVEQIYETIQDHAEAALRAKKAGFEGVEITSFMGYLLSNFLSPFTNRRKDEWGGSAENRGRFMVEVIKAIKKLCGDDFVLSIRLNGTELMDEYGGNTDEECILFMEMAEASGADLISIVIGWHESRTGALGRDIPYDHWLPVAKKAKEHIKKIPIAFGPRLADPNLANRAIGDGLIDFWEICRPGLADPDILKKIAQDKIEEIKPCIGCLTCLSRLFANQPYICTVNPVLGHEVEPEYYIKPNVRKKKVVVVGGGLSGMECAIASAQRGHEVTLYEKKNRVGGQLLYASKEVEGGDNLLKLIQYYENQLKKNGVNVILGCEFNKKICREILPDVVVVATGSEIKREKIPGDEKPLVSSAFDILEKDFKMTGEKIVIIGGGKVGLVTGEYFASIGNQVWIITEDKRVDMDVSAAFKWRHAAWVKKFNIRVLNETKVMEIGDDYVKTKNIKGDENLIEVNKVIIAGPRVSVNYLLTELEYLTDELYSVGDSILPRGMTSAIHEGYKLGLRI